ncbi:hypothetical protein M0R45_016031 [Rubus argutus]|uniref:EGF-like domain-containing protein n=1 Tax=Rubus argutus TaxID=59490 RepID=A0AAW1XS91_RUBAR
MALVPAERLLIMHLALVVILLVAAAQSQTPQVKPNCPERCGDIPIPYPFGIGADCYLRPEFNITCDQSTTPPSPKFSNSTFTFPTRITNFSHAQGELQVMQSVARECYDQGGWYMYNMSSNSTLELPPSYIISYKNNFFAVGCNSVAVYQGYQGKVPDPKESYKGGYTVSLCQDALGTALPTDSCNGFGCGQNAIPSGLQNMSVELYTLDSVIRNYNHWNIEPDYLCSYGFIVQDGNFTFSGNTSFEELNTTRRQLPVVVNWAIGEETCDAAKKNRQTYTCREHSECVDRTINGTSSGGYTCRCMTGFNGNPYLSDGCQDIDECLLVPNSNPCNKGKCINLPGTYTCTCDSGYILNENKTTCVQGNKGKNTILKVSLGISISMFVLLVGIFWLYCGMKKRKFKQLKEKYFKENGGEKLREKLASHKGSVETTARIFTATDLKLATNNYIEMESSVKEVTEQFTKECFRIIKWLP